VEFYAMILKEMENESSNYHNILVYTSDKNATENALVELGATDIKKAKHLSFVTARLPSDGILKMASYNFVHHIGADAESVVCGTSMETGFLSAQESIVGSYEASQITAPSNRNEAPKQVPDGFYLIEIEFNSMYNCLPIAIGEIKSPMEVPTFNCGLERMFAGFSQEDKKNFFRTYGYNKDSVIDPVTHFIAEPKDQKTNELDFSDKIDFEYVEYPSEGNFWFEFTYSLVDNPPWRLDWRIHNYGIDYPSIMEAEIAIIQNFYKKFDVRVIDAVKSDKNAELCEAIGCKIGTYHLLISGEDGNKFNQTDFNFEVLKKISPKKQLLIGVPTTQIICQNGMDIIFKYNDSPACVYHDSVLKLIERGWTRS
jgi:hypothetical protein